MIAAIVPAAGRSERMGRPKLILSVGGVALIARVVAALRQGGADSVFVIAPPAEEPGAVEIVEEARRAGAVVVVADRVPADMRASVELGIARLSAGTPPQTVLLAPGDSPGITPELVSRVVEVSRAHSQRIVVPVVAGKGGHPVALPWRFARTIPQLPRGVGVNALMKRHREDVLEWVVTHPGAVADLDTPDDYRRWVAALGG